MMPSSRASASSRRTRPACAWPRRWRSPRARGRCRPAIDVATLAAYSAAPGVERHDLARRALDVAERLQQHFLRFDRVLDLEAAIGLHRHAEVLGVDFVFEYFAVLELADHRRRAERDFVHAVAAVDDERVRAAELLQHADVDADQVLVEHADQLVRRARRVGQRAQDVEDRADAQFLAHRSRVLHRRMMVGREHEAHARLGDARRRPAPASA